MPAPLKRNPKSQIPNPNRVYFHVLLRPPRVASPITRSMARRAAALLPPRRSLTIEGRDMAAKTAGRFPAGTRPMTRALNERIMLTRSAYSRPYRPSSSRAIRLAVAGLLPPVDTAICNCPRRTTAGRKKSQIAGISATFVRTFLRAAAAAIRSFTTASSVAHTARKTPRRSACEKPRVISLIFFLRARR